jgi:hypothetical protein
VKYDQNQQEDFQMRKLFCAFLFMAVFFNCATGQTTIETSIIIVTDADSSEPLHTKETGYLEVNAGNNGKAVFSGEKFHRLNLAGEPQIPWRVLTVLLPPDVELSSLLVEVSKSRFESCPSKWTVPPIPPMVTLHEDRAVEEWPTGKRIENGRDMDIYERDVFWPEIGVRLLGIGQLHRWLLVELAVPLARYNPVRGELKLLTEAEVDITFRRSNTIKLQSMRPESASQLGQDRIKQIAINYEQAKHWYRSADIRLFDTTDSEPIPGYVIITISEIENTSSNLADFIAHKESLGFTVNVVTEEKFGGGIGDEAAENIRAWLQDHYIQDSLIYVLLIGDPRPDIGTVPMKMVGPASYDPNGKWVASDYYYAELTGNWDLDGDGYYGEWPDANGLDGDFGPGGIDTYWEVLVGRIPCYQADEGSGYSDSIQHLDSILSKTMWYETQTEESPEWRRNILLASTANSGCFFPELIKNDILVPNGWPYHRIYQEDYGLIPAPETIPCNVDNVTDVWSNGQFGLAVWFAHGAAEGRVAAGIMRSGRVVQLNDAYPCFTFQMSCGTARPDTKNNLAYELLKNGAVCTVGATRTAAGCRSHRSCAGWMAYGYTSSLVAGLTSGEALYNHKQNIPPVAGSWQNYKVFNIYGDPSLRIIKPERTIRFVDINATGRNDGLSWANAYNNLQDALATAFWGDQLWVAGGDYKPDQGNGITPGDRAATFQQKNGVAIYGGFPPGGGTWEDRDPIKHKTILSGDLDGNDGPDFTNNAENSYHVVTAESYVFAPAAIDGFIITAGNSNGSDTDTCGAGIYCRRSDPTIANCAIYGNAADRRGGGIYCRNSNPTFVNCAICDNSTAGRGGGMDIDISSSPILCNCIITGNSAEFGGGISNRHDSNPTLTNCTLSGNWAKRSGGGTHSCSTCSLKITNCIFWINTDKTGISESAQINGGTPHIGYCCVQGWTGLLGGTGNIGTDPLFIDPDNADYHLKSEAGRWDPISQNWVQDDVTSPCIDKGDPNSPVGNELFPNGGRINMGAYGGTAEASKSTTN